MKYRVVTGYDTTTPAFVLDPPRPDSLLGAVVQARHYHELEFDASTSKVTQTRYDAATNTKATHGIGAMIQDVSFTYEPPIDPAIPWPRIKITVTVSAKDSQGNDVPGRSEVTVRLPNTPD